MKDSETVGFWSGKGFNDMQLYCPKCKENTECKFEKEKIICVKCKTPYFDKDSVKRH
jgi:NADH pyrophosphatase NudC (nudix superfamily)